MATISNSPIQDPIILEQDTTFQIIASPVNDQTNKPVNLTDYVANFVVKRTVNDANPLISLSSVGPSGISINVIDNTITITFTPDDTNTITFNGEELNGIYSMELIDPGGDKFVPMRGDFTLTKQIA